MIGIFKISQSVLSEYRTVYRDKFIQRLKPAFLPFLYAITGGELKKNLQQSGAILELELCLFSFKSL